MLYLNATVHNRFPNDATLIDVPLCNRIIGVIYLVFSFICICPYIVCLLCILEDSQLRTKPTYIIVLHIGLADMLQLVLNGMAGGIFTFFGTTWSFWINKLTGGFMNIGWVIYTAFAHVFAFNRFICICKPQFKQMFFSTHKTHMLMGLCWLYGLAWLIAYMCPDISLVFNVYYRNWDYDATPPSRRLWFVELIQDTFHFLMSVIWYSFSFAAIRKTAGQITAQQINENKKERKLLIQAALICCMIGLTLIGFFGVPEMDDGTWATTASTLIWLACCGNNCAIFLTFNRPLRRRVLRRMRCEKTNQNKNWPVPTTFVVPLAPVGLSEVNGLSRQKTKFKIREIRVQRAPDATGEQS